MCIGILLLVMDGLATPHAICLLWTTDGMLQGRRKTSAVVASVCIRSKGVDGRDGVEGRERERGEARVSDGRILAPFSCVQSREIEPSEVAPLEETYKF